MVRLWKHLACAALLSCALAAPAHATETGTAKAQVSPSSSTSAKPFPATPAASNPVSTRKTRHHKKAAPVAEVPQAPLPPPTLDQQPPAAPHVTYRNGLLTIDAPNSTLSSILRAVQQQTGATVDVPAGAGSERVAMALGPGQPKDVLHSLLNGSKFDYVILGVAGQPGAVQKVILTPRLPGGMTATQTASAPPPEPPSDEQEENVPVADTSGESEYPGPESNQAPVPPGGFRRPPMGAPGGQQYQQYQQNPFPPGESNNVVKTPEQLMQELQQMQQQQEQYQEQLNPANRNPEQ